MSSMDFKTYLNESLEFLDNISVKYALYSFIIIYILFIIPLLTPDVSHIFNNTFVQLIFLFFIIYISFKDIYLGILFLIALLMSLNMDLKNMIVFSFPNKNPNQEPPSSNLIIEPQQHDTTIIQPADTNNSFNSTQKFELENFEPMGYNDNNYRDIADIQFDSNL
jgi:hypothetical protein